MGPACGVKAAGGIRDLKIAQLMIQAGATRIGTSSSIMIMQELRRKVQRNGDEPIQEQQGDKLLVQRRDKKKHVFSAKL